ncbi:MAG: hypothetical protein JST31_03025 [Actinobacteria bacterium]|nr:hypothetical protein [Actinomycetota bacterium]
MRIVDPWINADMPEWGDEPWMVAVAERYLGSGRAGLRRLEAAELLEAMDAHGVERAILDFNLDRPSAHSRPRQGPLLLRPPAAGAREVRRDLAALELPPPVLAAFTAGNAERVFFGES